METRDRYGEMQGERVNQGSVIGAAYTHVMQVQKSATTRTRARCHWVTRRSRHHAAPHPPSAPCRSHGVRGGASGASALRAARRSRRSSCRLFSTGTGVGSCSSANGPGGRDALRARSRLGQRI
jgi:hypothetical protein